MPGCAIASLAFLDLKKPEAGLRGAGRSFFRNELAQPALPAQSYSDFQDRTGATGATFFRQNLPKMV